MARRISAGWADVNECDAHLGVTAAVLGLDVKRVGWELCSDSAI
jgi:hypothetical protein